MLQLRKLLSLLDFISSSDVNIYYLVMSCIGGLKYVRCCCSAKECPTLCDITDCSMPGSLLLQYLLEFAQIYVH